MCPALLLFQPVTAKLIFSIQLFGNIIIKEYLCKLKTLHAFLLILFSN